MLSNTRLQDGKEWIALLSRLDHPNVELFLGFYVHRGAFSANVYGVSAWVENGNVSDYMTRFPRGLTEILYNYVVRPVCQVIVCATD